MASSTGYRPKASGGPGYSFLHLREPSTDDRTRRGLPLGLWARYHILQQYEEPKWKTLAVLAILCLLTYPILLAFVILANGKSLFWTRLIVGVGSGITGLLLGLILVRLARAHLEAAVWATVIHQSNHNNSPGLQLKDLALHAEDPASIWAGCMIFWKRFMLPGTARKYRASYDRRPWALHVIFFLFLVVASSLLTFLFGRIVDINTGIENQHESYYETSIKGDLSDNDIKKANEVDAPFQNTQFTWTLTPYSINGGLPPVLNLSWSNNGRTDTVYFSETTRSQLQKDGSGFGTFDLHRPSVASAENQRNDSSISMRAGISPGDIIRQPKWGVRIKCNKVPDPVNNILPNTPNEGRTRVLLQQETITDLLDYFNKPVPTDYDLPPLADDKVPAVVDKSKVLTAVDFENNGVSSMYWSHPLYNMGDDDTGFVSVEMVLIRLNTTFAPQGIFPVLSDNKPDANGNSTWIGYDAAVCIEMFEPWVVDVYNGTIGTLTTLRIVDKANTAKDTNIYGKRERMVRHSISDPNIRRELTSRRMESVYVVAHENGINQLVKDNGRDSAYVPSPNIISHTDGQGAYGYTSLSAEAFETTKASSDASNMLPYFIGSGSLVVRVYPDLVLAFASIDPLAMIIALVVIFLLGLMAALFVPRLPLGVPRRGFGLYSWLAAFRAEELVGMTEKKTGEGKRYISVDLPIEKGMDIGDIEKQVGGMRFRDNITPVSRLSQEIARVEDLVLAKSLLASPSV